MQEDSSGVMSTVREDVFVRWVGVSERFVHCAAPTVHIIAAATQPGCPLVLGNVWDVVGARTAEQVGFRQCHRE